MTLLQIEGVIYYRLVLFRGDHTALQGNSLITVLKMFSHMHSIPELLQTFPGRGACELLTSSIAHNLFDAGLCSYQSSRVNCLEN